MLAISNASIASRREQLRSDMYRRDVLYNCGACGFPLNLSSSQRTIPTIDSTYSKSLRKGTMSFLCIDESRFKLLEEFKCAPFFHANGSFGLHQMRTKLLCGNCGKSIGHSRADGRFSIAPDGSDSSSGCGTPEHKRYRVKIKALQPSLDFDLIGPAA